MLGRRRIFGILSLSLDFSSTKNQIRKTSSFRQHSSQHCTGISLMPFPRQHTFKFPILPFARHISFVSRLPKPSAHLARIASSSHSLPAPRPTGAGSLVRTALPCAVRRASVVPLAALTTIPPVSAEGVADIKDWMAVDRTYEGVYRNKDAHVLWRLCGTITSLLARHLSLLSLSPFSLSFQAPTSPSL
jgi:hypothetical protein